VRRGGEASTKYFAFPAKMCWGWLKIFGHSLKKLGRSQKTLRHPGVPGWLRACGVAGQNLVGS